MDICQNKITCLLEKYPLLGVSITGAGISTPFIETITPILQVLGAFFGVLVGAFTLFFQIQKFIKQFKNKKE